MTVSPFTPAAAVCIEMPSTHAGAPRCAAVIRAAWAKAGHDITVEVVPCVGATKDGNAVYGVRMPGLVNGLPT